MCIPTTRYVQNGVHIHVQVTLLLLSGGPDAAQEVSVEFEEDLREEFLQHAILTLSWESPASQ